MGQSVKVFLNIFNAAFSAILLFSPLLKKSRHCPWAYCGTLNGGCLEGKCTDFLASFLTAILSRKNLHRNARQAGNLIFFFFF
jgi:hypothetical protein